MAAYIDSECSYLGGDHRVPEPGDAIVAVTDVGIQVDVSRDTGGPDQVFHLPGADIHAVDYEAESLGMEQAEVEEGVLIGEHEALTRHAAVVTVRDPEDVCPTGLRVRLRFRDEFRARVLEKRCKDAFHAG